MTKKEELSIETQHESDFKKMKNFVTSWINKLFEPSDPASLAFFRISFGILMMLDIPHERQLSIADKKWGNPKLCLFPLIHSLTPLPYHWMCIMYLIMWLGTLGIALGYFFRRSCLLFIIPYWYIILLDKTQWNNHTYLFGLIAILLFFTDANAIWSIDNLRGEANQTPPFWNYFILRYQVFILYFMAAVQKINYDWLAGYSMEYLSNHWIFSPFKIFLTSRQTDFWIIHISGFIIDAFAGFGLQFKQTRPITLFFLFLFHTMNSRLFNIGMFPYVGLATMLIFCDVDWPRKILTKFKSQSQTPKKNKQAKILHWKKFLILGNISFYMLFQLFMPFSHFITKGYNGWTNGRYGYSWDMMVHAWHTSMVVVKVMNNNDGNIYYLDPNEWVLTDKWTKHADTVIQFAKCAKRNLKDLNLENISIYIDVWCSLNGRFHQRMFDPYIDLLKAEWSPFEEVSWALPLLTELSGWRTQMKEIQDDVYAGSNYSDVIFMADFPEMSLENYVDDSLINVSLTVLKGQIKIKFQNNETFELNTEEKTDIPNKEFHEIHTISPTPSCYMYHYYNKTLIEMNTPPKSHQPNTNIFHDIHIRIKGIKRSIYLISEALVYILTETFFSY